jgi:L-amino acid N-acyltransferase YncA
VTRERCATMDRTIRSAEPGDAHAVQAIYAPFVSDSATSFETVVPDVAEIRRRIEAQRDRYPWLVFEMDGTIVGYAYASAHRARQAYQWSVDVSVYVDPRFHRRGIGRALYLALFDLLRRQRFVNAYAGITLPNPSSVGLHQAVGFEPIGVYRQVGYKFDRWHDVMWLHLRLCRDADVPADPVPIAELWKDPPVLALLREHAQHGSAG